VVHGQDAVVFFIFAGTKEAIGRYGTETADFIFLSLANGFSHYILIFFANHAFISSMGVESQNSDAGFTDTKVDHEGAVEHLDCLKQQRYIDGTGHISQGYVARDNGHSKQGRGHDHQCFLTVSQGGFQVFSVAGE